MHFFFINLSQYDKLTPCMGTESGNNYNPNPTETTIQSMIVAGYKPEYYAETEHCSQDYMFKVVEPVLDSLLMKDWATLHPPTVVDLGSGTGEFSENINKRYLAKTLNIDLNYYALRAHPDDKNLVASALRLPLKDSSVYVLHMKDVLVHIGNEHLDECMSEIHRVLTPGGTALIVYVNNGIKGIYADNPSFAPDEMPMYPHVLLPSKMVVYERSTRIYAATEAEYAELTQEYYNRGDDITAPYYQLDTDLVIDLAKSYQFDILESTYIQKDDTMDWYTPKHYQTGLQSFKHPTRQMLVLTKPHST